MTDPALDMATKWIASFEGFRSEPYLDSAGIPTIGLGFTYLPDGSRVTMQTPPMSRADADAYLSGLVSKTLDRVREMVHVPITNHAAASLCSLGYNVGTGPRGLGGSTLMRLLNAGEPMTEVAKQFGGWCYAGGHISAGLVQRRKNEADLFLCPDVPADAPKLAAGDYGAPVESAADRLMDAELQTLNTAPGQAS